MSQQRTITTTCPTCGESFDVSSDFIGYKGRCESCETKFVINESFAQEPLVPTPQVRPHAVTKSSGSGKQLAIIGLLLVFVAVVAYQELNKQTPATNFPPQVLEVSESIETEQIDSGDQPQKTPELAETVPEENKPQEVVKFVDPEAKPVALSDGKKGESVTALLEKETTQQDSTLVKPLQNTAKKAQRSRIFQSFPVKDKFKSVDMGLYQRIYPNVNQGWMPKSKDQAGEAMNWGNYLGPLGVRIRSHVPQLQNRPAFVEIIPQCIRTAEGELGLSAAEVVQIAPGAPAEGYLEIGDLIIGIEGEPLKSGNYYRPGWDFMHKDRRELQLMLGEEIDQAQGRGDIRLNVLRYPESSDTVFSLDLRSSNRRVTTKTISVEPGDQIRLVVDANGNNEDDHLAWLSPKLLGKGKSLDLSNKVLIEPDSASTGWGEIAYHKDLTGGELGERGICVHAPSTISFTVPEGYHTFQTSMKVTAKKGDLNASIQTVNKQQNLPIKKMELWSGEGGNQAVGFQPFSVAVSGEGFLTLETQDFDGNLGGDGSLWMDVTLVGDYGTKKLFDIPWDSAVAGYGSPSITKDKSTEFKGEKFDQVLHLHAHGSAIWTLPKGTKRVKGNFSAASYGKVQPRIFTTKSAYPLTGVHKNKLIELRFPLGKAGSFSSTYPKDCAKSELVAKRHTEWLAVQQRENGSWPRLHGYTTDGWDTAWCALALMSSDDRQYDEQISRAAYRIAYETTPSEWVAERAMRLIFLSEYYLRTKDAEIVAGIQAAYHQVIACCKTDFMSGHKVNGFGYGIAGQHYGTGHMALAIALATKTPIKFDSKLVSGIIRHAGEVCVNGTYAYGRGRRLARDDSRYHGGGNAMVGPGMLGAILAGGHQSSIKEVLERWDASLGDADNSHATSSLAFIWASLAMAAEDESLFLKSMQNFKYKMTIDDNWEGGILKSAFPLDFQGGEGVTGVLIRSAGSILVLNAAKHNLAITGKKEFKKKQRISTTAVSEWGGQIHSYYLRNWCIAQELLGRHAPQGIAKGIAELKALPRTMELVPGANKIVMRLAPTLIVQIAKNRSLSDTQRAYAIELLCGLDFIILASEEGGKQKVELTINQPFHQLNWLDEDKSKHFDKSHLALDATVKIQGENLLGIMEFKTEGLKHFNLDSGSRKWSAEKPLKNASETKYTGDAEISFKIGKTRVKYKRPLFFNAELVDRGKSDKANLRRLKLKLRIAPRAYYQSQPLIIAGTAFDCMFLTERMVDVIPPKKGVINIHEGDRVTVDLSSENLVCPWVYSLKFDEMTQVNIAKPKKIRDIRGSIGGDLKNLTDFDYDSFCEMKHDAGKSVIEYDFGKEITLNGLDANYRHGCFVKVWFKKGDRWIPIAWDNYSPDTSHNPTFPDTKAKLWRVEIQNGSGKRFHTLRFYYNPNMIVKQGQPPHVHDSKLLPSSHQPK